MSVIGTNGGPKQYELDEEAELAERADLRGLVMSGGKPFILITVEDPETGEISLSHGGLGPEADLPAALQEIALLIA